MSSPGPVAIKEIRRGERKRPRSFGTSVAAGQSLTSSMRGARKCDDGLDSDLFLVAVSLATIGRMAKSRAWIRADRLNCFHRFKPSVQH